MGRVCCVAGCNSKINLHRFPNPETDFERCQAWIRFVRLHQLYGKTNKQLASFRICDKHFANNDKYPLSYRGSNLKHSSVPTIYPEGGRLQLLPIKDEDHHLQVVKLEVQEPNVSVEEEPDIITDSSDELVIDYNEEEPKIMTDNSDELSIDYNEVETTESPITIKQTFEFESSLDELTTGQPHKKKTNTNNDVVINYIEKETDQLSEDDSRKLFLLSLLPDVQQLSIHNMHKFQIQVLDLLDSLLQDS